MFKSIFNRVRNIDIMDKISIFFSILSICITLFFFDYLSPCQILPLKMV
jgi:hypothetical protein